ncbi:hypothetical protein WUBG_13243 [Wuchereria bancrofti]|uniref:Uncharacterized protein n=1 Tax=Wuchereria bancrofti TaxID=6293 RepID=J9ANH5_WUCBA|nr:hypothetical protein WUBG_13243 [Wuchereria bancrofti]
MVRRRLETSIDSDSSLSEWPLQRCYWLTLQLSQMFCECYSSRTTYLCKCLTLLLCSTIFTKNQESSTERQFDHKKGIIATCTSILYQIYCTITSIDKGIFIFLCYPTY